MKKPVAPVVKRPLFWWVLAGDRRLQALLLVTIVLTSLIRVLPLEMQKRIINETIQQQELSLLLDYCGIYLLAVLVAGALKYLINVLEAVTGQQATMEIRRQLYDHILRLPLNFFKKTQPGLVVTALVNEVASAGDFIGQSVSVPVTNILTLVVLGVYLVQLNPLLAGASLLIYPLVLLVMPRLQRRANALNKQRIDQSRGLSSKIGETISGLHEIHAHGAHRIEVDKFTENVRSLQRTRVTWNLYRFGIKAATNFFNNLSPFFIFILGGYLAMRGRLDLGALVAFVSAQEKLFAPWKELIDFYQDYQDASVSYYRTMEYFDAEPEHRFEPEDRTLYELGGIVEVQGLSLATESGIKLLESIDLSLGEGEQVALVGHSGSGKSTLVHCIAQLSRYTGGSVRLGGREVAELTKKDVAHNIGFVSQTPFIFDGTFEQNLLYVCRADSGTGAGGGESRIPSLDDRIAVLQQTGVFIDVLRFGLNSMLDPVAHAELIPAFLSVRKKFHRQHAAEFGDLVEFFEKDRYMRYSSVARNLTFGFARQAVYREENLHRNPRFVAFLESGELLNPLLELGAEISRRSVDILGGITPDETFFENTPFAPEQFDEIKRLCEELKGSSPEALFAKGRIGLLELALRFIPARHTMVAMPQRLQSRILAWRSAFKQRILETDPEAFTFYHKTAYLHSQTILNNIIFGDLMAANPGVEERIGQRINQLLIEEGILETVMEIGMQFQVGTRGDRLSGGQRQKLAVARVLLKNPRVLILDEATSALDNKSQNRIQHLLDSRWRGRATVISVVHRLDIVKNFDRIVVLKAGKVNEMGGYAQLMERRGAFYELVMSGR